MIFLELFFMVSGKFLQNYSTFSSVSLGNLHFFNSYNSLLCCLISMKSNGIFCFCDCFVINEQTLFGIFIERQKRKLADLDASQPSDCKVLSGFMNLEDFYWDFMLQFKLLELFFIWLRTINLFIPKSLWYQSTNFHKFPKTLS